MWTYQPCVGASKGSRKLTAFVSRKSRINGSSSSSSSNSGSAQRITLGSYANHTQVIRKSYGVRHPHRQQQQQQQQRQQQQRQPAAATAAAAAAPPAPEAVKVACRRFRNDMFDWGHLVASVVSSKKSYRTGWFTGITSDCSAYGLFGSACVWSVEMRLAYGLRKTLLRIVCVWACPPKIIRMVAYGSGDHTRTIHGRHTRLPYAKGSLYR